MGDYHKIRYKNLWLFHHRWSMMGQIRWGGTGLVMGGSQLVAPMLPLHKGNNRLKVIGQPFGGGRDPEECRFLVGWWRMDDS